MDEEELPPPFYDSIEPYWENWNEISDICGSSDTTTLSYGHCGSSIIQSRRLIMANDFFQRMCKEAQDEIASGDKGWKEADTNTLLLACFGMLTNHLTHKLARPLWFFSSAIAVGVIAFIIKSILG